MESNVQSGIEQDPSLLDIQRSAMPASVIDAMNWSSSRSEADALEELRRILLVDCRKRLSQSHQKEAVLLLSIPRESGYLARSDILEIRLADCHFIKDFVNLTTPRTTFKGSSELPATLDDALRVCAGACFISRDVDVKLLRKDLFNRLSVPLMQRGSRP